jgi:hypothetical protein
MEEQQYVCKLKLFLFSPCGVMPQHDLSVHIYIENLQESVQFLLWDCNRETQRKYDDEMQPRRHKIKLRWRKQWPRTQQEPDGCCGVFGGPKSQQAVLNATTPKKPPYSVSLGWQWRRINCRAAAEWVGGVRLEPHVNVEAVATPWQHTDQKILHDILHTEWNVLNNII